MGKSYLPLVLLLVALAVSGCTSTHEMLLSPRSLHDVNGVLQRHPARIILQDGQVIEKAQKVRIREDRVEYLRRGRERLPLEEVSRIEVDYNRGRAVGAAAGSGPGALLMAMGTLRFLTASDDDWGQLGALLAIALGTVTIIAGGVAGDIVGGLAGEKRTYVVYRASQEDRPGPEDR